MTPSMNLKVKLELLRFCFEFPMILQGNQDLLGPPRTSQDILGLPRSSQDPCRILCSILVASQQCSLIRSNSQGPPRTLSGGVRCPWALRCQLRCLPGRAMPTARGPREESWDPRKSQELLRTSWLGSPSYEILGMMRRSQEVLGTAKEVL